MRVEWQKVTWYSKLLAVVLFTAIFFLGFYFGALYERKQELLSINFQSQPF